MDSKKAPLFVTGEKLFNPWQVLRVEQLLPLFGAIELSPKTSGSKKMAFLLPILGNLWEDFITIEGHEGSGRLVFERSGSDD